MSSFMLQYGFDGVDVDWEYPGEYASMWRESKLLTYYTGACDRGGSPVDIQNYPLLLSTLRSVFDASGHTFGITFTAPSSFWYLQNFDLPGLLESADWINLMTYDLHGGKLAIRRVCGVTLTWHTQCGTPRTSISGQSSRRTRT